MKIFKESARELTDLRAVLVTGLLIAVSMVIESFSINLGFAKINFAFLAIASIGMLYGPFVAFFAGGMCDVLGFLVAPTGGFLPLYTLLGAMQGLIYGLIAYRILPKRTGRAFDIEILTRLIIARLIDIVFINLICNTAANYHYGFLRTDTGLAAAIVARISKNLLELPFDIILIAVVLTAVLKAYTMVFGKRKTAA